MMTQQTIDTPVQVRDVLAPNNNNKIQQRSSTATDYVVGKVIAGK